MTTNDQKEIDARLLAFMGEQDRANRINQLIRTIADCGRKFFRDGERVSRFEWQFPPGRWVYVDEWQGKRRNLNDVRQLAKLHEGGTLKKLLRDMLFYIRCEDEQAGATAVLRHLGPWPEWVCGGDLWGYGADMEIVRTRAAELLTTPGVPGLETQ